MTYTLFDQRPDFIAILQHTKHREYTDNIESGLSGMPPGPFPVNNICA
jgi:hypothetical protein